MRVGIIGATLIGNRGAEAMVSATVKQLMDCSRKLRFTLFSYFPESDRMVAPEKIMDIRSGSPFYLLFVIFPFSLIFALFVRLLQVRGMKSLFPAALSEWAESEVVIDVSGVSFMDVRMTILPYDILIIVISALLGTPLVKFSQAMGPFKKNLNRYAAKIFLKSADHIFARGEETFTCLKSLHLKTGLTRSSDIALLHRCGDSITNENGSYVKKFSNRLEIIKKRGRAVIGICPSSVVFKLSRRKGFDYLGYLSRFAEKCANEGYYVLLFPNATKDEDMSKIRNNDLNPIKSIAESVSANLSAEKRKLILCVDRNINTDGIKQLIQWSDLNIVSRFHAMIASLQLTQPVIVLGWSHKYFEVMSDFALTSWVFDYKSKSSDELFSLMKKCHRQKAQLKKKIAAALPSVQMLSMLQIEYVNSILQTKTL